MTKMKTLTVGILLLFGAMLGAHSQRPHAVIEQPITFGMIKILLEKNVEGVNVEVRGGYKVYDPKNGSRIGKGSGDKQYLLRPTLDGLAWGEGYPGVFQVAIVPAEETGAVLVNGIQYAGSIYAYQIGNTISIVNEVPIESFVKSMLSPKVNANLHPEVLAALAIVARTQAYYYAAKNQHAFWHLDAGEIDYRGMGVCFRNNGVEEAADLTHHLVMKSEEYGMKEGFFDATYTPHCAGKTAPYHLIFRKEGFAPHKGIESPLAQANRSQSRWVSSLSKDELARKLGTGEILRHEVYRDSVSGKVYGLRLFTEEGNFEYPISGLQSKLGSNFLKSNDFVLKCTDEKFTFQGHGEGLGVGLCLYTAQEMAKRGENAAGILSFFFPHSKVAFMKIMP